jgi:hypothetical protein
VDFKSLFGFTVIPAGLVAGTVAACVSKRVRDLFFLLLVFLAPVVERVDVNFVSREWYRGTARGFEVSIPGLLAACLLLSCVLAPRPGERRAYWAPSLGLVLLFFLYAALNVAMSSPMLFGLFELDKMGWGLVIFLAVAFYLRSERELRLLLLGLAVAVCYQALLGLTQRYVGNVYRVYGTMDESNSLSLFFCTTAPVLVAAFNSRIPTPLKGLCAMAIALAGVGEILTISRAGVVILGLVLLGAALGTMSFRFTARKTAICLVVVLAATGALAKAWKTLTLRFEESTLKEEYQTKKNMGRGYYLRVAQAIAQNEFFGVGLNNWSYWVTQKYGPRLGYQFTPYKGTDRAPSQQIRIGSNLDEPQAAPAHNLGALTLGELGVPGLLLFALVWMRWFQMGASFFWRRSPELSRQLGVGLFFATCGLFLQDLTEWAFRHLPVFYTFHILLGALASLYFWKKRAARQAEASGAPEAPRHERPIPTQVFT